MLLHLKIFQESLLQLCMWDSSYYCILRFSNYILGLPDWSFILNRKTNVKTHTLIIFEDISTSLNRADQVRLNNFLYQSRHNNISLAIVTHNLRHAFKHNDSFERIFLHNCSAFFLGTDALKESTIMSLFTLCPLRY